MLKQWFINKNSQIEHRVTREISEFGLNGELYDVVPETNSASFTVLIRNVVIAGSLIRLGFTQYPAGTIVNSGEELVVRLPMHHLPMVRDLLNIPDLNQQLVIANRS